VTVNSSTTNLGAQYMNNEAYIALHRLSDYRNTKLCSATELLRDATASYIIGGCRQNYGDYMSYIGLCIHQDFC
jgi:hypothetical protein